MMPGGSRVAGDSMIADSSSGVSIPVAVGVGGLRVPFHSVGENKKGFSVVRVGETNHE